MANLRWPLRGFLVLYGFDFGGVHVNSLTINPVAEKLCLRNPKFTFRELSIQFHFLKQFQSCLKMFFMFLLVLGVDKCRIILTQIIMANLPPNHVVDLPEDNPEEQPELAPEPDHLNIFAPHQIPQSDENDDDDDAEVINPYEEANPLNLIPPDSDTESEDMAVAPTPDDHEQEAEAATVGTITRVPYSVRPFSGTVYVGIGPSWQVFAPGPTGRDVNTLHRQAECVYVGRSSSRVSKGDREENKKLKKMLESTQRDFDRLSWHHRNLRQWSFEVQWNLHPFRHYRQRPYVAPTAPVAHVDHADPDDPSPCPTRRPRHDDPYVKVRDAATRNEGNDVATTNDP
ncbi:hypothetical protein Tco_1117424 [Tanacetum coccineum]